MSIINLREYLTWMRIESVLTLTWLCLNITIAYSKDTKKAFAYFQERPDAADTQMNLLCPPLMPCPSL